MPAGATGVNASATGGPGNATEDDLTFVTIYRYEKSNGCNRPPSKTTSRRPLMSVGQPKRTSRATHTTHFQVTEHPGVRDKRKFERWPPCACFLNRRWTANVESAARDTSACLFLLWAHWSPGEIAAVELEPPEVSLSLQDGGGSRERGVRDCNRARPHGKGRRGG